MKVAVEHNRFLSVRCGSDERIVFDRQRQRYHLLRGPAALLWDEVGGGGTFELPAPEAECDENDPVARLAEANLLQIETEPKGVEAPVSLSRRVWMSRTARTVGSAIVLPMVATIYAGSN